MLPPDSPAVRRLGADRLATVTASNAGVSRPAPAIPAPCERSSARRPAGPHPGPKVSPVIEGGAYAAKAAVGERFPIRARVFREGHDAVNASVILTDPDGAERREPMHPTTPLGFDWWTAAVVLDTEGPWTFRVEGWSDPWETWVHNAEIKIPAGIDVALVCTEGKQLFATAADAAEARRRQAGRRPAARRGQEPGLRSTGGGPARGGPGRRTYARRC